MREVRVVIWGFGAMGSGMARMLIEKKGVEIVGVCDRNAARAGKDMYEYLGVERKGRKAVTITKEPEKVITEKCCDVLLLATDSFTKSAFERLKFCLEKKVNVITIAEELSYPKAQSPELAKELDKIAQENGVTLLGTGINPGFVLDYLILALTGTCENVESIYAKRVNDLSPFGRAVMHEQGVGITQEEYKTRMAEGTLAGHVGFPESINMIM
ncbi:MAG: saccharopine dehydrogenase NADP-binding domain-containing protein, partial [Bacillota bacterium]|nr:saccharopine dehydrogenase NADP-binding domain-containing protein [Bacillota bacterium]